MSQSGSERHITTDVLVIGGGMAGMFAAIKARERGLDVTLTDKAFVGKAGTTHYSEGDILFFRQSKGHNLKDWLSQISVMCEYINNRAWDEICLIEAEERFNDLAAWGVPFYKKDGELYGWDACLMGGPPGAYEDVTMQARKFAPTLRSKALDSGVRILDNVMMIELLRQAGTVVGAVGFHVRGGGLHIVKAGATVIATGASSFKSEAYPTHFGTGDGEAMAYRAGCEITGREFSGWWTFDRTDVARLQDACKDTGVTGEVFDASYQYPFAIAGGLSGWYTEPTLNAEGGAVITPGWEAHCGRAPLYLDPGSFPPKKMEWLAEYFRRIKVAWAQADKIDLDIFRGAKIKWPSSRVAPRSIWTGTGIWPVDTNCASSVPGLYAAGNSCGTRGSGALYAGMGFASNHAMVTGARAGLAAADYVAKNKNRTVDETEVQRAKSVVQAPLERKGGFGPAWVTQVLQSITVPYFYLDVKHRQRLEAAITIAEFVGRHLVPKLVARDVHELRLAQETRNMALNVEMKLKSSLFRTESRGNHFREDYPRRDDPAWLAWVKIRDDQGEMQLYKEPVPTEWWPDLSQPYEQRYPAVLPLE